MSEKNLNVTNSIITFAETLYSKVVSITSAISHKAEDRIKCFFDENVQVNNRLIGSVNF